jgi:hypothetical protein
MSGSHEPFQIGEVVTCPDITQIASTTLCKIIQENNHIGIVVDVYAVNIGPWAIVVLFGQKKIRFKESEIKHYEV